MSRFLGKHWILLSIGLLLLGLLLSVGLLVKLRSVAAVRQLVESLSNGKYVMNASTIKVDPVNMVLKVSKLDIHPVDPGSLQNEFEFKADSLTLNLKDIIRLLLVKRLNVQEFSLVRPELKLYNYEKDDSLKAPPLPLYKQVERVQNIFFEVLRSLRVMNCQIRQASVAYYPDMDENVKRYFLNNINLSIYNLQLLKKIEEWNNENKVNIRLELTKPSIEYPDSSIRIDLDKFFWDTKTRHFELNGFGFHKSITTIMDSTGFRLEGIHLDSLNWTKLLKEGILELGVLKASRGKFSSSELRIKKNTDTIQTDTGTNLLDIIGPIIVRNLAIKEIEFSGKSHSTRGIDSFRVVGNEFGVSDLVIDKNNPDKVAVDELKLKVKAYVESDSSGNFISGFGEMSIRDKNLVLKDYFLRNRKKNATGNNSIDVKQLTLMNLSLDQLLKGNLKASNLVLTGANFNLELEKMKTRQVPFYRIQRVLRRKLDIDFLTFNETTLNLYQKGSHKPFIKADSIHTQFSVKQLLRSYSIEDVLNGNDRLIVPGIRINLPGGWVECRNVSYQNDTLKAEYANGLMKNGLIQFRVFGLEADKINPAIFSGKATDNWMRSIQIQKGSFQIREDDNSTRNELKPLSIQNFKAGDFKIVYQGKNFTISSLFDTINIESLALANKKLKFDGLYYAKGKELHFTNNTTHIKTGKFNFSSTGASYMLDNIVSIKKPALDAKATIPTIEFTGIENGQGDLLTSITNIKAEKPEINITVHPANSPSEQVEDPANLELPTISLIDPNIRINRLDERHQTELFNLEGGQINASTLTFKNGLITSSKIEINAQKFNSQSKRIVFSLPGIKLKVKDVKVGLQNEVTAILQDASIKNGSFEYSNSDSSSSFKIQNLQTSLQKNIQLNFGKNSLLPLFHQLAAMNIAAGKINFESKWYKMESLNFQVTSAKNELLFDMFSLRQKEAKEDFFARKKFETDFIEINTGRGTLKGFKSHVGSTDTSWQIGLLDLNKFYIDITRDKRYPRDSIKYRPLLADMLKRIPIKFSIDSILLDSSRIEYHEFVKGKSDNEINIWFGEVSAAIHDIRNVGATAESKIIINASSRFLDKGNLSMAFAQPYLDTNQNFTLRAKLGSLDLKVFSPIINTLYNAKIQSGNADSASINAVANEKFATGNMLLDYQDLKVAIMHRDGKKKGFLSFVANTILKNDNEKTAVIFQPRWRDRSIFNYWAKIALNGLLGNMGLKNNQKKLKQYYRNGQLSNSQ